MKRYFLFSSMLLFVYFIYSSESPDKQKSGIKDIIIIETTSVSADGRVHIDRIEQERKSSPLFPCSPEPYQKAEMK